MLIAREVSTSYAIWLASLFFSVFENSKPRRIWEWDRVPFNGFYDKSLLHVEFAINTAVRLAERLPNARFYIEELTCHTATNDPFLVMDYSGESYYLEVWGETEFEKQHSRTLS